MLFFLVKRNLAYIVSSSFADCRSSTEADASLASDCRPFLLLDIDV